MHHACKYSYGVARASWSQGDASSPSSLPGPASTRVPRGRREVAPSIATPLRRLEHRASVARAAARSRPTPSAKLDPQAHRGPDSTDCRRARLQHAGLRQLGRQLGQRTALGPSGGAMRRPRGGGAALACAGAAAAPNRAPATAGRRRRPAPRHSRARHGRPRPLQAGDPRPPYRLRHLHHRRFDHHRQPAG